MSGWRKLSSRKNVQLENNCVPENKFTVKE